MKKEELLELIKKHKNNQSHIAKELGCSRGRISNLYKKFNLKANKVGGNVKYIANHSFFSSWNKEMAYCMGLLASDGHIWKKRPFFTIALHKKDKECLEYLVQNISPETKIRKGRGNQLQICVHSEQISKDLNRYGINHNKTFNLRLPNIPKNFFGDFLRGFFDGDGSIWSIQRKGGVLYYRSGIASASKKFLEDVQKRLGYGKIRIVRKKYYELYFNQPESIKLRQEMYYDNTAFSLKRKKERFLKIKTNPNYSFYSKEEDKIILKYDNKTAKEKLKNRTLESIANRRRLLCKKKK
jgi:hypothetical protein